MKITNIFYIIGAIAVLTGAIMKLNSIEYSFYVKLLGILLGVMAALIQISNLRKTKKNLEKENKHLKQDKI